MNFSTSKFCNERKREREGKKEPRAEKRGVWSRAGERDLSFGIFQERVPIPLGGGGGSSSLLARPGQTRGEARGRAAGRGGVGAGSGGCSRGPRAASLFRPGDLRSRPLPHPGLSRLPHPTPPPPRPSPARAPPPARTRSRSPSRTHMVGSRQSFACGRHSGILPQCSGP